MLLVLQVKGQSDSLWVVSLHENPQQIRAVMCKGGRHPPAVPRPMLQILPYQLPLCALSLDKGNIEVSVLKRYLFSCGVVLVSVYQQT